MIVSIINLPLSCLTCYFATIFVIVILLFVFLLYVTTNDAIPIVNVFESEQTFVDPKKKDLEEFPFNQQLGTVSISVIIPAYNEESRLPIMLDAALEYLSKRQNTDSLFSFEIIIVDDGSKDNTTQVALQYVNKYGSEKIRVLTLKKNRGKGGAVRLGVFSSRGSKILFADADGATKFSDLDIVEAGLDELHGGKNNMAISIGSRAHLQEEAIAERSLFRNILMYGFHFLVYVLCVKGIKDTQCGFKLLTRKAALTLFSTLHVERWAFDVELLYAAQYLGIPIAEKAVNWQEIEGSKMVPIFSWLQMGKDLLLIRVRYVIGAWKIWTGPPNLVIMH
ncbi:dolichyl-phosphate beta-glucosyltransferase isoform X2 [Hydra vulgaris]|uniref:dolichyl-phosphate beta-glucosyltransferase n=1 Tax=Hydra vulgaris TaxID=6087 RepID=A0ABM4D6M3_HYDVU